MESNLSTQQEKTNLGRPGKTPSRDAVAPRVDVFENGQEFLLVAEIPGATKESVHVALESGELTLSASRPRSRRAGVNGESATEYMRTFSVPDTIDADKIEAELTNGLLSIKLPKRPEVKTRKISVRAS